MFTRGRTRQPAASDTLAGLTRSEAAGFRVRRSAVLPLWVGDHPLVGGSAAVVRASVVVAFRDTVARKAAGIAWLGGSCVWRGFGRLVSPVVLVRAPVPLEPRAWMPGVTVC